MTLSTKEKWEANAAAYRETDPIMLLIEKQSGFADVLGLKFSRISLDDFELEDEHEASDDSNVMMEYENYVTPVGGKTMADLMKAADFLIEASGDHHHIFIEAVPFVDGQFQLVTGS